MKASNRPGSMTLALAFLLLLLTIPLAGGRLGRLEGLELRSIWLAALAFGIQVVIVTLVPDGDTALHRVAHLASYALVGACVLRNLHVRFLWVVALGGLLNLIAIVANSGVMPASRGALDAAGLGARSGEFANSDLVEGANLAFLALHAATGSRLALRLSPS